MKECGNEESAPQRRVLIEIEPCAQNVLVILGSIDDLIGET